MQESAQTALSAGESPQELGFWGRLVSIFANPRRTFAAIEGRPTWLMPLLLTLAVTIATTQITFPIIMTSQLETFRSNPDISPEKRGIVFAKKNDATIACLQISSSSNVNRQDGVVVNQRRD